MILDTARVRLLRKERKHEKTEKRRASTSFRPYLIVFQAEISDATHGGCLTLGKILVHLVDALRDVVVSFVE
jgi:hypothetical protein